MLLKIPREDFDALVNRDPRVAVSFSPADGPSDQGTSGGETSREMEHDYFVVRLTFPGQARRRWRTISSPAWPTKRAKPVLLLDLSGKQRGVPLLKCERLDFRSGLGLQDIDRSFAVGI